MIEGTTKREPKKDVCHFAIILEVIFQNWFPLEGVESQEKKTHAEQPQEGKGRRDNLKERFINNKRLLNPTHIFPKKEKWLEIRTTRRTILKFKCDDDERKPMHKRQKRQEDTIMKGNIDPQ